MPKRKADDSAVAEPKSKKEKLAEIRRRVAEGFGKEDKAKFQASRSKFSGETAMAPVAAAVAAPSSSPAPKTKKKKSDTGSSKKSQREEARKKAKAFFDGKTSTPAKSSATATEKSTPRQTQATSNVPVPSPVQQFPMHSPPHPQHYGGNMGGMNPAELQAPVMFPHPLAYANQFHSFPTVAQFVAGGMHGMVPAYGTSVPHMTNQMAVGAMSSPQLPVQSQTSKAKQSAKKNPSTKPPKKAVDAEGSDRPPSIDRNTNDAPKQEENTGVAIVEGSDDEGGVEGGVEEQTEAFATEEETEVHNGQSVKYSVHARNIFGAAASVGVLAFLLQAVFDGEPEASRGAKGSEEPKHVEHCFLSSSGDDSFCEELGKKGVPCPKGGQCLFGELSGCTNKYFSVSENGSKCVPSDEGESLMNVLLPALAVQSKNEENCDPLNRPLVEYSQLQQFYPNELPVENGDVIGLLGSQGVKMVHFNRRLMVGLPSDHAANALPLYCRMANASRNSLNQVGNFVYLSGVALLSQGYSFSTTYPLYSLLGLVGILALTKYSSYKKTTKQNVKTVANATSLVLKKLQARKGEAVLAVHLRDEISHDLFPESEKKRKIFAQKLFGRVANSIIRDTRVEKGHVEHNGKQRETWKWDAKTLSK